MFALRDLKEGRRKRSCKNVVAYEIGDSEKRTEVQTDKLLLSASRFENLTTALLLVKKNMKPP
jgi:hypothetical protein